ncbi:MAG: PAS domain-containing protein, partial [Deltaproteobacteria bacterium]|nr:PAS domain-containing protein [Deltaproteobacteria bacterium]
MRLWSFIFKDRSLGYKFALFSFVPIIIVTIFIAFYIINSMERSMIEKTRIRAMGLAKLSALSMSNTFVIYNKNLLDNFVDSLGKEKNILYAMIVDSSDSRILAHSDHQNDGKIFTAVDLSSLPSQVIVPKKQGKIYELSAPIIIGGRKYGVVRLGFSLKEVHQEIAMLKNKIIIIAIIAIILGAFFSLSLARIISNPVRALAEHAKRIGTGDFEQKIIYESKDALGQLAGTFNKMAEKLKLNVSMLKENEERFTKFMEYLPALAFMKDAEGHYIFANSAYKTILGIDPADRIGKTDDEVWPAEVAATFRERDHKILATGQPLETADTLIDSTGRRIIHLNSKFPIFREGKPALIGGI